MNPQKKPVRYAGLAVAATSAAVVSFVGPANATASYLPHAVVAYNTLTVIGTDYNDTIAVTFSADGKTVSVDSGEAKAVTTFYRNTFTRIAVFLRDGDDQFRAQGQVEVANVAAITDTPISLAGGYGDDEITGGTGNDLIFGNDGDDELFGGAGVDILSGDEGRDAVDGGVGVDTEFLGYGADTALWAPGEGSDVVHGGPGKDNLDFVGNNAPETLAVTGYHDRAVLTRDLGNIRMDLDGVEDLDVRALGGVDKVTVNDLAGSGLHDLNVDLSGPENFADSADDTVVVNGTTRPDHVNVRARSGSIEVAGLPARTTVRGSESTDHLRIYTLAGRDKVAVHRGVDALIGVSVNLGIGQ